MRRDGADTPLQPSAESLLVDVDLDHPDGEPCASSGTAFHREFSPRVSSTTLAMTWLAAGRRAAYLHEGDLRDNVHFAAPIAIAQAAGCVVTGDPRPAAAHGVGGLLAAADEATHAASSLAHASLRGAASTVGRVIAQRL